MAETPVRYQSPEEDSARWFGFPFRDGNIVISTRSKTGTTWVQMICALLVFQTPELPAPLAQLSPWLDHLTASRDDVYAQLAAQKHRRLVKTHTPLDGIPLDPADSLPGLLWHLSDAWARSRADRLVPTAGLFKSDAAFFRRGTSGAGREILSARRDRRLPRAGGAAGAIRLARLAPLARPVRVNQRPEGVP
jgi:Sulfotransferase domain